MKTFKTKLHIIIIILDDYLLAAFLILLFRL
jgi:hypothetical protein